jgi:nitronate monooxygenase
VHRWRRNKLTEKLGIDYPIIQGPFGRGGSTPRLAALVSNGGGLGSFGANDLGPEDIIKVGAEIKALTDKPWCLNLWVSTFDQGGDALEAQSFKLVNDALAPYYKELGLPPPQSFAQSSATKNKAKDFDAQFEAMLVVRPAMFSFVFGIPTKDQLERCTALGITTAGAASTVDEAIALDNAGVDMIVAAGFEAGGHRPSFLKRSEESLMGLIALVPQIVDRVKVPVVAAGGIADGRGLAAALNLGASAAQIGTAFLACDESGASDEHRRLLFSDEAKYTGLSRAYTGRLARGLYNRFAVEMKVFEKDFAPYPAQSWIVAQVKAAAIEQGRQDLIALWSGQAAPLLKYHKAEELLAALVAQADKLLE